MCARHVYARARTHAPQHMFSMYDFPYNVMKPKYGVNIQSLMTDTDSFVYEIRTDTDSFVYEIKTEDFYADMKGIKEHYDMSED